MTDVMKKAQRANKAALVELYQANKQRIYYLCALLLCDDKAAESTCIQSFRATWDQLADGRITTEEDFSALVVKKAVNLCKNKLTMSNNSSFKVPQNNNFIISQYPADLISAQGGGVELLLKNLPALHRFIYVLNSYLAWSDRQISELLHISVDLVQIALNAESMNIERLTFAINQACQSNVNITAEELYILIDDNEEYYQPSDNVDEAVFADILDFIESVKAKSKKKKGKTVLVWVCVGLSIALLAFCVFVLFFWDVEDTEATNGEDEGYEDEYYDDEYEYDDNGLSELPWVTDVEDPTHYAVIDIADYGKVALKLDGNIAPDTVENFVTLAKEGFYDGLTFHRIIEGFMMQGGDPNGNGTGGNTDENGNEINIVGEFYNNDCINYLSHVRGAISMARGDDPNSASSQFFIVQEDSIYLDGDYAVFGYVVNGMDVVDAVCGAAEPTDNNGTIPKSEQPIINSVTIYTPEEYAALSSESESQSETQN